MKIKGQLPTGLVCVALGSNLGHTTSFFEKAIFELRRSFSFFCGSEKAFDVTFRCSPWYLSKPEHCPKGTADFLNAVCMFKIDSPCEPYELLENLLRIEVKLGRPSKRAFHAPRCIDLDLIAFGPRVLSSKELYLPHPRAVLRQFVMEPFSTLLPDCLFPGQTKTVAEFAKELREQNEARGLCMKQVPSSYRAHVKEDFTHFATIEPS